jgi:cytochrome c-type biogenesis protein CcmF
MGAALVGIVSRNRRRYGGYIVHAGVAVLLIGIAASSSFQTKRDVVLRPGQSAVVDGRRVTYVRPTAKVDKLAFRAGAVLRVEDDGGAFTVHPTRNFYRPTGVPGGGISSYFGGESDSEIALEAGLGEDFWSANQPNIAGLQRHARAADTGFEKCVGGGPGVPPQCRAVGNLMRAALATPALRPQALERIEDLQLATAKQIAAGYVSEGAPTTFRVIVNPLATWIWIGGLIALAGALIALWPARRAGRAVAADPELEALKEAKYREIRDAELDHAAGKLSDEDFALLDAELRKEAVAILDRGNGAGGNGKDAGGNGRRPEAAEQPS